jgi:hypothetical protein
VAGRKGIPNRDEASDADALQLIANLLGIVATKDMGEGEKVATLSGAGFSNQAIARLLNKDVITVGTTLFNFRKKSKKRK